LLAGRVMTPRYRVALARRSGETTKDLPRRLLGGPHPTIRHNTGKYGMFAILESVRQLRGEAAVQVPGVALSFVQGVGL
jgi:hypothetical protein